MRKIIWSEVEYREAEGRRIPLLPMLLSTALTAFGLTLFGIDNQRSLSKRTIMKKMTIVVQAVLDRILENQIAQDIQTPELSAMVKIKKQIEDTLIRSKLTEIEKLNIIEPALDKYGKLK